MSEQSKRLDAMAARWTEVNQRQGRSITRLMVNRQRVLDIANDQKLMLSESVRQMIRDAVDSDVDPELIVAIAKTMNGDKPNAMD